MMTTKKLLLYAQSQVLVELEAGGLPTSQVYSVSIHTDDAVLISLRPESHLFVAALPGATVLHEFGTVSADFHGYKLCCYDPNMKVSNCHV
jgi:hypothetical protein